MRYFFVAVTAILCFGLVLFGPQAAAGAAEGFELFISCVFPSLFPFFVCVALLKGLGVFGVKSGRAGAAIFKIFAVSYIVSINSMLFFSFRVFVDVAMISHL